MSNLSPFHEGEVFVQERTGERDVGLRNGAVIADTILKGALRFISQQPFIVTGSMDDEGRVWASVILGQPGFMTAAKRSIDFDLTQTLPNPLDPFWKNIERHPKIGTLIIELTRRRRLRVNGPVTRVDDDRLRLDVSESYPNCPKYIQRRTMILNTELSSDTPEPVRGDGAALSQEQASWVADADTVFVASAHPGKGVDASHRGGKPGFIHVIDDRTLRIPDYAGNSIFNTLGNFVEYPQAGLLFIDFESGRTLQLVGKPTILWDLDVPDHETGGTCRYWKFEIEKSVEIDNRITQSWQFVDYSPFNP